MQTKQPVLRIKGAAGRKTAIENCVLRPHEYLVEVTHRASHDVMYIVDVPDESARIYATFMPVMRKGLFSEVPEIRYKYLYIVSSLFGIEHEFRGKKLIDSRPFSLFCVKRGPQP